MKTLFISLSSSLLSLSILACSSSHSSQEPQATTFDTSAEQRFRATGNPRSTSPLNCDWSQNQTYKTDSRLREGMRFTQRGTSPMGAATMQTTIVSASGQSIVSDILIVKVTKPTNGIKDGMKFRQTCAASGNEMDCSMTPQPPSISRDSCYVRSNSDAFSITYTDGTFTMADGREVPAELERRLVKGTLICFGQDGREVEKGNAEENAVTIRSKTIPNLLLTRCEGTTSIYSFREVRSADGSLVEGDQTELIETPN